MPDTLSVERTFAFNFLSPNTNQIDGSSAGNSVYTAWNFGFGYEWNNLVSLPITASVNSPRVGDGRYSLNGQLWTASRDRNGLSHGAMVDSLGIPKVGLKLKVVGSFSTYNTGGSPYGNAAGGVPSGWNHNLTANPGSMGLSHLWIDARWWNDTDPTVSIFVDRLDPGRYTLVLWLNPTNHDPLRSARIDIQNRSFRFNHIEGADYDQANELILTDILVPETSLTFDFSTFSDGTTNMDSSLAGFAVMKML